LYAIEHGASIIYDTDDDNAPHDVAEFENNFDLIETEEKSGLILDGDSKLVQNPYAHFGQRSIWPRGYPLEEIGQEWNNSYKLCSRMKTPLIQQALVNGDPDVDAIFRYVRFKITMAFYFANSCLLLAKSPFPPIILEPLSLLPLYYFAIFVTLIKNIRLKKISNIVMKIATIK
jgi:hypothetical protein